MQGRYSTKDAPSPTIHLPPTSQLHGRGPWLPEQQVKNCEERESNMVDIGRPNNDRHLLCQFLCIEAVLSRGSTSTVRRNLRWFDGAISRHHRTCERRDHQRNRSRLVVDMVLQNPLSTKNPLASRFQIRSQKKADLRSARKKKADLKSAFKNKSGFVNLGEKRPTPLLT